MYMTQFPDHGSPEGYPLVLDGETRHSRSLSKKHILLIILGSTFFLTAPVITGLIVFKTIYQQNKTTTVTNDVTALTTLSISTTEEPIDSSNAQCPAENCPYGRTVCLTNKMPNGKLCEDSDTPICCSPNQGWCCQLHAPVCCGLFSCCPLKKTCCTINGIEQCCPISDSVLNNTISTIVK